MASTRIDMRVDNALKQAAEKAAALEGINSLTEYISRLIERDAKRVIAEHQAITLEDDIFDRFTAACNVATAPNQKLRAARNLAQQQGFSS
jgi:uncharacterized protein (DUF1778 family)